MTERIPKLIDSAFLLAALTGLLYFWGVCNLQGDAGGLGIPAAFVARDLWGTVSYGAEGAFASTLLFALRFFTGEPIGWIPIATLAVSILASVGVCYLARRSQYRLMATITSVIVMMSLHIQLFSQNEMIVKIKRAASCSSNAQCEYVPAPNRIAFLKNDKENDERSGILMNAGTDFVVMQTHQGLFILPIGSIKAIETAPRAE